MTAKIKNNESEKKRLKDYLAELHEIFLKKLGEFITDEKRI